MSSRSSAREARRVKNISHAAHAVHQSHAQATQFRRRDRKIWIVLFVVSMLLTALGILWGV